MGTGSSFRFKEAGGSKEFHGACVEVLVQGDVSQRINVLFICDEWGSSKGGLSTFNREFAVHLAKASRESLKIYCYVCKSSEEDRQDASKQGVNLITAKQIPGSSNPTEGLKNPPPEIKHLDVVVGHGRKFGGAAYFISDRTKCKWIHFVHVFCEDLGKHKLEEGAVSDAIAESEEKSKQELELCEKAHLVFAVGAELQEKYIRRKQKRIQKWFLNETKIAKNQLTIRGYCDYEEIKKMFREADVIAMPSRTEGFGLIALQAISAGVPVLVSSESGLAKALEKVKGGMSVVVKSDRPQDWAERIKELSEQNPKDRHESALHLREQYGKIYNWENECKKFEQMVHELVQRPDKAVPVSCVLKDQYGNVTAQVETVVSVDKELAQTNRDPGGNPVSSTDTEAKQNQERDLLTEPDRSSKTKQTERNKEGSPTTDEWRSFNNFGRSMFAGIVDSYLPDLVLQGVQENNFRASLSTDLKLALQHSVVDDPVSEAVCIIANTDKWTCEVVSVKKNRKQAASDHVHVQQVEVSNLVFSMLSSLSGLWDIKMSAEFCLMHLEDKLKEIYLKSKVITERLRDRRKLLTRDDLTKMLSVDDNDVPLLLAVASTHSPQSMPLVG
ncbi:hypothetical protein ACROYT_G030017 [Oculina patagonica]